MSLAMILTKNQPEPDCHSEVAMKQLGSHTIVMGIDEINWVEQKA